MATLKEILKHAEPLICVLEIHTHNTLPSGETDFGMVGGLEGHDGNDVSHGYVSNGNLYFSTHPVKGLNTHKKLLPSIQGTTSLPASFSGKAGGSTVAAFDISLAADLLELDKKIFDGANYTLKVGGRIYVGEAEEELLHWNDYKVWSEGLIENFDVGDVLRLAASRTPRDLLKHFPLNYHDDGSAKHFLIGQSHRNHSPKYIGDGVHDFHDGEISPNTDTELNYFPFNGLEDGELFGNVTLSGDAGAGTTYYTAGFDWKTTNDKVVTSAGADVDATFTVESPMSVKANSGGESFRIKQASDVGTFQAGNFKFTTVSDSEITSGGNAPVVVTIVGSAAARPETSYWFKITGPNATASRVRMEFDKKIGTIKLMARNVNQSGGTITIDNFSKSPTSTEPAYGLGINSLITIDDVGEKYIEFDFKGNGVFPSGNLVAFWIEEVTLYKPRKVKSLLEFDLLQKKIVLEIVANSGEKVINWSVDPVLTGDAIGQGTTIATFDEFNSKELEIEWRTGSGEITITATEAQLGDGVYGAFFEDGLIRLSAADETEEPQVIMNMKDLDTGDDTPDYRIIEYRAKLAGGIVGEIYLKWSAVAEISGAPMIKLSNDWQDVTFTEGSAKHGGPSLTGYNASFGMGVRLVPVNYGTSPCTVLISKIRDTIHEPTEPQNYAKKIKVLDPAGDGFEFLPTFKVPDVFEMPKCPKSIALYDSKGKAKSHETFESITGKFHGITSVGLSSVYTDIVGIVADAVYGSDGSVVLVGNFTEIDGVPVSCIAKITPDGRVDKTFAIDGGAVDTGVSNPVIQKISGAADGVMHITGGFNEYAGVSQTKIAAILSDGSLSPDSMDGDTNYYVAGTIKTLGGETLAYGTFSDYLGDAAYEGLMLFDQDNAPDGTFNYTLGLLPIFASQYSDGRICLPYEEKILTSNGVYDSDFIHGTGISTFESMIEINPDLFLVTGYDLDADVARAAFVQADGTEVGSFSSNTFNNDAQAAISFDGESMIVFGNFTEVNGLHSVNYVCRFNSDGSFDETFMPNGFDSPVIGVEPIDDLTYLVFGAFGFADGVKTGPVVRLNEDGITGLTYAGEVLSYITKKATGEDKVSTKPEGMSVAVAFTQRKPLIQWIDAIASSVDMYYLPSEQEGSIDLSQRWSGVGNPAEYRLYSDTFVIDSQGLVVKRTRSTPAQVGYRVTYYDNTSDDTAEIDSKNGSVEYLTIDKPKEIFSYVVQGSDAQYLANRDIRDVYGSSEYTFSESSLNPDAVVGLAGYVYAEGTNGYTSEIVSITEKLQERQQDITVNTYNIKRQQPDG